MLDFFLHLPVTPANMLDNHQTIRPTTASRHRKVEENFNRLYNTKVEGIPLDYDGIIAKLAADLDYSQKRIKQILKGY